VISAADRARHAQAVAEIFDLMRKYGLTLDDLIQIGGEDFRSFSKQIEKARRVDKCWSALARLLVGFADLEQAPRDKPARRQRGEGLVSEAVENKRVSGVAPHQHKSNEINDLGNSAPVGGPDPNSETGQ
jgi:hypothetical protein